MEKLRELEAKVIEWANERNFFGEGGATLFSQYLKLREEFGELSGNFAKGRCMKDDIGDVAVVVIIMNKLNGAESIFVDDFNIAIEYFRGEYTLEEEYLLLDTGMNRLIYDSQCFEYNLNDFETPMILVALKLFAESNNYNFTECLEHAYSEIKDRKGEWRNNTFVKTSDL